MSKNKKKYVPTFNKKKKEPAAPPLDVPLGICLNMIVKNEAAVIRRCIESVLPLIDCYAIVDTGSTDGTQQIIEDFFKEKGIPGRVINKEWIDFSTGRNQAIELAREVTRSLYIDPAWGFWIDADETLMFEDGFNKNTMKYSLIGHVGSNIRVMSSSYNYARMQFFSLDHDWEWYGPIHEILRSKEAAENLKVTGVGGIYTFVRSDGNSWTEESTSTKYSNHAKVLQKYVDSGESKDPRWLFYLAQSYRDARGEENTKKALEYYTKRLEAEGGYHEEKYFSAIMVGSMKALLKHDESEVIDWYLKCGKYNQHRADHLIPVILTLQKNKEFELAYVYSSYTMRFAGRSPFPNSVLFVDMNIYDWKLFELHAQNCHYTHRHEERKLVWKHVMDAVKNNKVPDADIVRIVKNEPILK